MEEVDVGGETNGSEKLDTTLVKGLRILEALSLSNEPLGVTSLSDTLGIGRSNTHRLLKTLVATGYVAQEPGTRRYLATLKSWEQGSFVVDRSRLRRAAHPVLRRLHESTGEVVFLSVLHGNDILYVDKIDPVDHLASAVRAGLRVPAVFTASGKALLANQPNPTELIEQILRRLPSFDGSKHAVLLEEMNEIRRDGFACSFSGWTPHANSVAVAVPNGALPPVAAIGTAMLSAGSSRKLLRRFAPILQRSAAELSAAVAPIVSPF